MDFGFYPPEINSGRMYSGPGSGPMLAAAQAWVALADELYTAASGYQSVVSELTSGAWSGPSSASMSAAAVSFVEWLRATAAQAEESAAQAHAAAAGYETAFAITVPPPMIAANRSLLAALLATNFFGQNTPAIAATEIQYAEMWAQDAAAMYGYAASSASATSLSPFTQPQQNTDPASSASQAATASQATSAGQVQSVVSSAQQAFSAVPNVLQGLATSDSAATGSAATVPLNLLSDLITLFVSVPSDLTFFAAVIPVDIAAGPVDLPYAIVDSETGQHADRIVSDWNGDDPFIRRSGIPSYDFPATILNPSPNAASAISAGMADAESLGGLSVPSGWTVAAPEVKPTAFTTSLATTNAAAAPAAEAGAANTFNQMGIGGMAGQAMAGPPAAGEPQESGKPARLTGRPADPPAHEDVEASPAPRTVVTGVAAAIRDIAGQRARGYLTEEEYKEQKKRLLEISSGNRPLA
ncbi:PPE family protein, SVP subgroup [Mycobacterium sp.]|uniref:PPE family protein, SVP subgroup n=1 Tax=Mycobacterium sp. TaxID=1785 RepID=UPI003BB1D540